MIRKIYRIYLKTEKLSKNFKNILPSKTKLVYVIKSVIEQNMI